MNDAPRRTLRELIAKHGPGLCSDARRCEGLLRDLCGEHRREINILVGASVVMLNFDTRLFPHHVNGQRMYDFSAPVAAVTEHPSNPGVWGLKNMSQAKWVVG